MAEPDPGGVNAVRLDDPQTWNMYAYVRNNPATLNDPTGLMEGDWGPTIQGYLMGASCQKMLTCFRVTDEPGPQPVPAQLMTVPSTRALISAVRAAGLASITVVFSENANPVPEKYSGGVQRTVDYQAAKIDPNGQPATGNILRDVTLTLHEEMDPSSKNPNQSIANPPQSQTGDVFNDYQFVPPGQEYRILRDWKVNDEPARVYDKQSGKTYRYEVTTLDANAKLPIKTEYTNARPWPH